MEKFEIFKKDYEGKELNKKQFEEFVDKISKYPKALAWEKEYKKKDIETITVYKETLYATDNFYFTYNYNI